MSPRQMKWKCSGTEITLTLIKSNTFFISAEYLVIVHLQLQQCSEEEVDVLLAGVHNDVEDLLALDLPQHLAVVAGLGLGESKLKLWRWTRTKSYPPVWCRSPHCGWAGPAPAPGGGWDHTHLHRGWPHGSSWGTSSCPENRERWLLYSLRPQGFSICIVPSMIHHPGEWF